MVKRIAIFALVFIVAAAVIFTGCTPARRPYNDDMDNRLTDGFQGNRTDYMQGGINNTVIGYGNNGNAIGNTVGNRTGYGNTGYGTGNTAGNTTGYGTTAGMGANSANAMSNRIETAVRQIEGVQNVKALVSGNTVYVGVTMTGTTGNRTGNAGYTGTTGNRTGITGTTANGGFGGTAGYIAGDNDAIRNRTANTDTIGYTGNAGDIGNNRNNGYTGTAGNAGNAGIIGNTANATTIERRVSQIVRALETDATTVYVSTDNNFINRLRTMNQGTTGGGVTNGLRDLVRGMTPVR